MLEMELGLQKKNKKNFAIDLRSGEKRNIGSESSRINL